MGAQMDGNEHCASKRRAEEGGVLYDTPDRASRAPASRRDAGADTQERERVRRVRARRGARCALLSVSRGMDAGTCISIF